MSVLTRITTRAKQIYKKGKAGISWVAAIKRASAQVKGKATPKRKRARTVKRKRSRRRVSGIVNNPRLLAAGLGKGPTITPTRKVVAGIGRVSKVSKKRRPTRGKSLGTRYKTEIKNKLANALLAYDLADTVKATRAAQKRKIKYRKILRAL